MATANKDNSIDTNKPADAPKAADAIKNVTSTLNDGLDKDMHIKTSMINKLIKKDKSKQSK